jgi:fumarate reductase subunit D
MNMFRLVVALLFLAYGLITSSGVGIMLSLLLGVVVGGLIVLATLVWPLYAKLRKATRAVAPSQDAGA